MTDYAIAKVYGCGLVLLPWGIVIFAAIALVSVFDL